MREIILYQKTIGVKNLNRERGCMACAVDCFKRDLTREAVLGWSKDDGPCHPGEIYSYHAGTYLIQVFLSSLSVFSLLWPDNTNTL
jgi:hypothetical protein